MADTWNPGPFREPATTCAECPAYFRPVELARYFEECHDAGITDADARAYLLAHNDLHFLTRNRLEAQP